MNRLVLKLILTTALLGSFSYAWAADPVCITKSDRKICYSAAADRVTPTTFDLSSRGLCHVATDTGDVTEWTGSAYIASKTCPGGGSTSTNNSAGQYADDADFTDDTSVSVLAGGVAESTATTVTDGDIGAFGMTLSRSLKTTITDSSGDSAVDATANAVVTVPDSTSGACSNADVDASLETICSITTTGYDRCTIVFAVATDGFQDFDVALSNDATTFVTIATTATDYTTPQGHIYGASGDLTNAASGSSGNFLEVDGLSGWDTLRVQAQADTANAAVTGTYRCQ